MAYLLLHNNENILINKVGESIYSKNFPQRYSQKTTILGKSNYNEYTANVDRDGYIHLIYKTSQNSILHLRGKESSYYTNTILEDPEHTYKITNLKMISNRKNYLFYVAMNPYENTADLIFHKIDDDESSSPTALLSLQSLTSKYVCDIDENTIYLLCTIIHQGNYELNLYRYDIATSTWSFDQLVGSEYPITDFSFVTTPTGMHIIYTIEKYGHTTLYYGQLEKNRIISTEITSLGQRIKPAIFVYNHIIWVNYLSSHTLYASFSLDNGRHFSNPKKCTIQNNNIIDITILGNKSNHLYGNYFLGYIDQQPNIAVLSQIDVDRILYYSQTNAELSEIMKAPFESTIKSVESKSDIARLQEEIEQLRATQTHITNQYNSLVEFTKEVQEEGKKWRKKYQKVLKELNSIRKDKENE